MSLKLNFHPLSSFCRKALVALYENETPFTPVSVDLSNATERAALLKLWPIGKFRCCATTPRIAPSRSPASSSNISIASIRATPSRRRQAGLADPAARPFLRSLCPSVRAEDRRRPVAAERQQGSAWRGRSEGADTVMLRHHRQRGRREDLGDGRRFQHCRLRGVTGVVLRQQGGAVRRHPQQSHCLFRSPEGTALLRARDQRGRALFPHVPATDVTWTRANTSPESC
jgi:hypothetical protein